MQRILVVEDNIEQRDMIVSTILSRYGGWHVDSASDYESAISYIDNSLSHNMPYSLFLLDIQLTEHSTDRGGFLIAEYIRSKRIYYRANILFLTGISDSGTYALSNFHCYNYITKPYSRTDILNQLEQMLISGYLERSFMVVDTNQIIHNVKCSDIQYIKSTGHIKTIYLANTHISTRAYTMPELLSLSDGELIECHKGYLVNPQHITSYDRVTQSINVSGHSVPVGRKFAGTFFNHITQE